MNTYSDVIILTLFRNKTFKNFNWALFKICNAEFHNNWSQNFVYEGKYF